MSVFKETGSPEKNRETDRPVMRETDAPCLSPNTELSDNPFSEASDIFEAVFRNFGLIADISKKKSDSNESSEGKDNSDYLEKGDDGKYYDKETGKAYDSIEAWKKAQETIDKRYESTAKYYDEKAKKEWARFKNAEENDESEDEKWEHYRRSQEYYVKVKECKEKAEKIREKLSKVSDTSKESSQNVINNFYERLNNEVGDEEVFIDILEERTTDNSRLPRNGGEWSGEPGNSEWKPDSDTIPGDRHGTNPEHKSWEQIMEKYKFDSIPFHDGEPDFSEVTKGTVVIDDFTEDRSANFDQADEKLAEQRGCTPEEVAKWREENKFTWHECKDCKTMQKVPTEVHGNISHSGGISEIKLQNLNSY